MLNGLQWLYLSFSMKRAPKKITHALQWGTTKGNSNIMLWYERSAFLDTTILFSSRKKNKIMINKVVRWMVNDPHINRSIDTYGVFSWRIEPEISRAHSKDWCFTSTRTAHIDAIQWWSMHMSQRVMGKKKKEEKAYTSSNNLGFKKMHMVLSTQLLTFWFTGTWSDWLNDPSQINQMKKKLSGNLQTASARWEFSSQAAHVKRFLEFLWKWCSDLFGLVYINQ